MNLTRVSKSLVLIRLPYLSHNMILHSSVYIWPTSSEPGLAPGLAPSLARCLAPMCACLHYRRRAPRQLDHQYAAALNLHHIVRVLIAFLQFRRYHRGIRWLVCNNYENINLKKFFDVELFVNSRRPLRRTLCIAWSLLRFCTRKVYDVRKLQWHNWDSGK